MIMASEVLETDEVTALPEEVGDSAEVNPAGTGDAAQAEDPDVQRKTSNAAEARRKSINDVEPGANLDKKRRASMFEEVTPAPPKDVKALLATSGGQLQETLKEIFNQKSHEADNGPKKPLRRPKKIFQNTYRLESSKPFCYTIVETSMNAILEQMLDKMMYNSETAIKTAAEVAEKIRARVLAFEFDRLKILVHVTIGPMSRQGVHQGFRCFWDSNRDSYAQATFRNHNIFVSAVVYAIYYE